MYKTGLCVVLVAGGFGVSVPPPPAVPVEVLREIRRDVLGDAFGGIALGDTLEAVTEELVDQCDELRRVEVAAPYLPLAGKSQTHLIASGVFTAGVEEAAFTFADGRLVQVEARGGAVDGLWSALDGEPLALAEYRAQLGERVVTREGEDVVWFLTEDGMHPHLYLWANPDLQAVPEREQPFEASAERPEALVFGAQLADALPGFQRACPVLDREDIPRPWLPSGPAKQVQINLYGLEYAGFPRKVEAVFGDDVLQLVWILTGAGEEARVRKALVKAYGKPEFVSKTWEAFDGFRVALRKDKPEVLMIADELVDSYREEIEATAD